MSVFDAVLIVGFGGPEKNEDVVPFLENVLRGKRVPRERMLEVAEHYYHFGGRSPINEHIEQWRAGLQALLNAEGPKLPVYVGNRNWRPMLAATLRQMEADGVKRALAFITSAFGSYSGCRQYQENIESARREVGGGAPVIDRLRLFYNHPGFLGAMGDSVRDALSRLPEPVRAGAEIVFTAHSIPVSMAASSPYVNQLREACELTAAKAGQNRWRLVYQSRSGPPDQPWLEPDVNDYLRQLAAAPDAPPAVVVAPIGFLSDHLEVLWDLDHDARNTCVSLNLPMERAATAGSHPGFVPMLRQLILERIDSGPSPDLCAVDCCPPPQRPPARS